MLKSLLSLVGIDKREPEVREFESWTRLPESDSIIGPNIGSAERISSYGKGVIKYTSPETDDAFPPETALEILTGDEVAHAFYGYLSARNAGYDYEEIVGDAQNVGNFASPDSLHLWELLKPGSKSAKVAGRKTDEGYVMYLAFMDPSLNRRGPLQQYTLWIPDEHVAGLLPALEEDPSLLIESFKHAYPRHAPGTDEYRARFEEGKGWGILKMHEDPGSVLELPYKIEEIREF
jgi:hypothetical protein